MTERTPDPELPRGIALAWGVASSPQRGPKREMSVERIVDAAVELADAGGLGAVSMSAVAARLGYTTMSLYRYVSAKDDLVLLMQEAAIGVPPETVREASELGWRAGLQEWAAAQRRVYARHPWALDIPIDGTPLVPNSLAWLDAALGVLAATSLPPLERIAVALAVLAQVRWQASIERGYADAATATDGGDVAAMEAAGAAVMQHLVTSDDLPEVHAVMVAGVFTSDGDPFAYGLERLLEGIAARIERGGRADPPGPPPADPPEVLGDRRVREAQKAVRSAEKVLRDARRREREALRSARERAGSAGTGG